MFHISFRGSTRRSAQDWMDSFYMSDASRKLVWWVSSFQSFVLGAAGSVETGPTRMLVACAPIQTFCPKAFSDQKKKAFEVQTMCARPWEPNSGYGNVKKLKTVIYSSESASPR